MHAESSTSTIERRYQSALPVLSAAEVGQLVADRYQWQGIGTAMLAAASREASRLGFAALVLAVHPDNRAVLAHGERRGPAGPDQYFRRPHPDPDTAGSGAHEEGVHSA
jgi:GNAT superfamily N-acetyltransferase